MKAHRPDQTHQVGGLSTWHHTDGVPPCLYRKEDIVAEAKLTHPENKCPLPDGAPAQDWRGATAGNSPPLKFIKSYLELYVNNRS